jgi:hypothetical protein
MFSGLNAAAELLKLIPQGVPRLRLEKHLRGSQAAAMSVDSSARGFATSKGVFTVRPVSIAVCADSCLN